MMNDNENITTTILRQDSGRQILWVVSFEPPFSAIWD